MIILAITGIAISLGWVKNSKTTKTDSVRIQTYKMQ